MNLNKVRFTKAGIFVAAVSALSVLALGQQPGRLQTIDDVMKLRLVSDPRISPDGRYVAFVVTQADMKTNFRNSDIWIVAAEGNEPRALTRSPKRDDQPQWSPDSRRLAFISDREGKAQVYVISIDGGEAERLTDVQTSVQSFAWSPDCQRIAFISPDPLPESREKEKKDGFDQVVVDADYQYAHISVIDAAADRTKTADFPKPVKLTEGSLHATELAWSPDGAMIAFSGRPTPKLADSPAAEVYLTSVKEQSTAPRRLTNDDRTESDIAWSPDGKMLSYLSTSDKFATVGPARIHLLAVGAVTDQRPVQPRILMPEFDGYIRNAEWSRDGRFIYFGADLRVRRHICRVTPDGGKLEVQASGDVVEGPFTLTRNSDQVAYIKEDPAHPADVWFARLNGNSTGGSLLDKSRQLTRMNPDVDATALGRAEVVRWKSSKDSLEVEGLLVYPAGYRQGTRYPLITSVHGGPEGAYLLSFMASHGEFPHVYAGRGYACFFPNFRGSSNYGARFAAANVGDLGGGDYQDVMSGVDYLIQRGIADPARLAVKGWSYGGYMSGWIIGHTDRFKAAAFGAGLANAVSYYSQADIQFSRETLHQGTPWRNRDNMIERSPVFYLQNAKTPSLIFHGEKDERVPLPQSLETYMGLKKAGVACQLVVYPREPHGLREPKHQLDKMRREFEWLEKYLSPSAASATR